MVMFNVRVDDDIWCLRHIVSSVIQITIISYLDWHKIASGECEKDYRNTRDLSSSHYRWHILQLTILWPRIGTEDQATAISY